MMTTLTTVLAIVGMAPILVSPQGSEKPKMKAMSSSEVDRQLSTMAGRPQPVAFKLLYKLGVGRLENETASMALRWPSSVDGYGGGSIEMVGMRGGSNTQNWHQSVIDLRFHTSHANKTHAVVIPVVRHAQDSGNHEYEVRINGTTMKRTVQGASGAIMATWKPTTAGFQLVSVKLLSPGRFFFETVEFKYLTS